MGSARRGKESATDSATEKNSQVPPDWVPIGRVARAIGCSHRTLLRRVELGDLEAKQDSDGRWWFDPEAMGEAAEASATENAAAAFIEASSKVFGQILTHNEKLFEPSARIVEFLVADKATDRARIADLEARLAEQQRSAERALSEENERMMARQQFEEEQRRLNKALDFLSSFQPLVMAYVAKHVGLPTTGEAEAISTFLGSFSEEEVMGMVGNLPQEKAVVVLGIFEQIRARQKGATTDGKEASSNGSSNSANPAGGAVSAATP